MAPEAPGQQHLFDNDALPSLLDESDDPAPAQELPPRKRKKGHGRRPIPDHLPCKGVPHDVSSEEQVYGCGREKFRFSEDVNEQLEYEPGKLRVLRHIYPKYACSHCKDSTTSTDVINAGETPVRVLDRTRNTTQKGQCRT